MGLEALRRIAISRFFKYNKLAVVGERRYGYG